MQYETQLVRNTQRALGMRKQAAEQAPMVGHDITTPFMYLQEQWNVWGDGRTIIDSHTRVLLLLTILQTKAAKDSNFALSATIGTAKLLSAFVARYSGLKQFDAWVQSSSLSETEGQAAVHGVLQEYFQLCSEKSFVEGGVAAQALIDVRGLPCVTADEELFAAPALQQLIESHISEGCNDVANAKPSYQLKETAEPRFIALCGSSVTVKAIKEEIEHVWDALENKPSHTVVFCKNPLLLYDALSPYLTQGERGKLPVQVTCTARVPFYKTPFGQALFDVYCLSKPESDWILYATDFAYNPLSGISKKEAENLNYEWRTNQCYINKHAISYLLKNSSVFKYLYTFVTQLTSAPVEYLVEQLLEAKNWCVDNNVFTRLGSYENESAFEYVLTLTKEACSVGNTQLIFEVLQAISLQVSKACQFDAGGNDNAESAVVEFRSYSDIDSYASASIDAAIIADVSKTAFLVPSAKPATANILESIGIPYEDDSVQQLRLKFCSLLQAPQHFISFVMPIRDSAGKQQYPSFVFEEYVNAASIDTPVVVPADKEEVFKVPSQFASRLITLDERSIVEGAGQSFAAVTDGFLLDSGIRGAFTVEEVRNHLKKSIASEVNPALPRLSPSQIETYLQCPYYWFVDRKIGITKFDTSIDAALIGSCVHEVFKQTFEELAARGYSKITETNLEEAQCIAENIFDLMVEENVEQLEDALMQQSSQGAPSRGKDVRLFAATEEGAHTIAITRKRILSSLEYMTHLPDAFEFYALEYEIAADQGVTYAGAVLSGSIDRIDINSANNTFAILDYKGSIFNHEAGVSKKKDGSIAVELPHKVQALMYAQMLMRSLSNNDDIDFSKYTCAGALYLSYKARSMDNFVAGSFDSCAYDARPFTANNKSLVQMDFLDYLNEIEQLIAPYVSKLADGIIDPNPLGSADVLEAKASDSSNMPQSNEPEPTKSQFHST